MTDGNAEIQKLVAFENAFETLFAVMEQEGGVDGGIVVQDSLQLLANLLRYNSSNQVRLIDPTFDGVELLSGDERGVETCGCDSLGA
jgi:hypothetical protein